MSLASEKGYLDIIQQFSGLVDPCDFVEYANTAVAKGHLSILKYFIYLGTDIIDIINYENYCALGLATSYKHNDVVKYLINNTANKVNYIKTYIWCVISSASDCNTEIFELVINILIKDGADINQIFSENPYVLMNCMPILELAISN